MSKERVMKVVQFKVDQYGIELLHKNMLFFINDFKYIIKSFNMSKYNLIIGVKYEYYETLLLPLLYNS